MTSKNKNAVNLHVGANNLSMSCFVSFVRSGVPNAGILSSSQLKSNGNLQSISQSSAFLVWFAPADLSASAGLGYSVAPTDIPPPHSFVKTSTENHYCIQYHEHRTASLVENIVRMENPVEEHDIDRQGTTAIPNGSARITSISSQDRAILFP